MLETLIYRVVSRVFGREIFDPDAICVSLGCGHGHKPYGGKRDTYRARQQTYRYPKGQSSLCDLRHGGITLFAVRAQIQRLLLRGALACYVAVVTTVELPPGEARSAAIHVAETRAIFDTVRTPF